MVLRKRSSRYIPLLEIQKLRVKYRLWKAYWQEGPFLLWVFQQLWEWLSGWLGLTDAWTWEQAVCKKTRVPWDRDTQGRTLLTCQRWVGEVIREEVSRDSKAGTGGRVLFAEARKSPLCSVNSKEFAVWGAWGWGAERRWEWQEVS